MVKGYHDWNSCIEAWESDGRVFRAVEPIEHVILMEVFAFDFLSFDGRHQTELRGTVTLEDEAGFHTIFSSDEFQPVPLGRFDALTGGDFSVADRPIDGEYEVRIHTDVEDKTHGELFLMQPDTYRRLQGEGHDFKRRLPHYHNEEVMLYTTQNGLPRTYDSLCRYRLVGPYCALNVLFAVYWDAVAATVRLTFMQPKQDFHPDDDNSVEVVGADVWGRVTARNTVLTDPEAFSTLFARTTSDRASLVLGDLVPLSKPSVVVPATSSLLLDLDLQYSVQSSHKNSHHDILKTKSSFNVPALQPFESFVDVISPEVDGAFAMLKVEVKWLKLESSWMDDL